MSRDTLNDAMATIKNYEMLGKEDCVIRPSSKLLIEILKIFQKSGYIGDFEVIETVPGGEVRVNMAHKINNCGAVKPRFYTKRNDIMRWEMRYLPSMDFGLLIMSTSKGIMAHKEAKENNTGGTLLAYVY
ncbi:MAG: 30S ribosomal protein S8 [Candidatus Altiarchaeum hamiconexum]|uniref:Small ribosomal subunit protein uS8 n=1 Tax=Candidatus Altarchaeum hamiconexum TaxID=1803513 RepID=A0A8J7YRP9_9ARCH|nr:30S ribosomal protein S8 [Candidatus Altarchaeum hamiconexum]